MLSTRSGAREALLLGLLAACAPAIPSEERPKVVQVVFDPAVADLPTPNDLAMSGGKVAIGAQDRLSAAENELKLSMNGLEGFSTGSSPRVQLTGPISAASISEASLPALDLGVGGKGVAVAVPVVREYAPCDHSISLASPTGFLPGHVYLFAVRGGAAGLAGEAGEEVVGSPAFHFLRAGKDLREHPDALPGATRAERQATAERLEGVRATLEPLFQILEKHGLPRREVAALWSFTAHSRGEPLFDPAQKKVPFPNTLLVDSSTGLVSLPISASDSADSQALKRGFNKLDGFATTAALAVETTAAVDRATVTATTVRLFRADVVQEVMDVDRTLSADGKKVVLQPRSPLRPATPYVVVLAGVMDSRANPLAPMPLASLLKLKNPLLDEAGESVLSSVCTPTAARLEPLRVRIDGVLASLEKSGLQRSQVSAAYTFTTQDIAKRARALWMAPYTANLPLTVSGVQSNNPPLTMLNTSKVISGRMTTIDFLDPTTRAFRDNGNGLPREIEFVLAMPKGLAAGAKVPVVIFGHGLNTERRLGLFVADRLAKSGFATMAIDLPLHGERTVCLKDGDCELGATCAADGSCTRAGAPAGLARIINGYNFGRGTPVATGGAWVDIANLFGVRDHFRQALVDLSAQARLVREMDWKPVTGGFALDGNKLMYAGISLGGIIGGEVSGVDPNVHSMLLNVGGAGLVDLIRESSVFGPTLRSGLSAKGITEGTPAYDEFLNAGRWALDEVDPLNLAPFAIREPLVYADPVSGAQLTAPKKRLRLQMAIGDPVVPNSSTQRLVTATGINKDTELRSFIGSHGFLADPVEVNCYVGQDDMATFLEGN